MEINPICQRPALRYFGGKWRLAPWIISHFPAHKTYVEPYGGGASVLLRKPRCYAEIYNDLDTSVVETFRVLQNRDDSIELECRLRATPFARAEFEIAYEPSDCRIERARRMIIRSFMGFGSGGVFLAKTGFRANSNMSGTTPAHDWLNYWDRMAEFQCRLSGVVIENRDALDVMRAHDSAETVHFVDPPYVHDTRGMQHTYNVEMTDEDHEALILELRKLKGYVFLSGYSSKLYSDIGWFSVTKVALADGARKRTEVLWLNPKAYEVQQQMNFKFEGA